MPILGSIPTFVSSANIIGMLCHLTFEWSIKSNKPLSGEPTTGYTWPAPSFVYKTYKDILQGASKDQPYQRKKLFIILLFL